MRVLDLFSGIGGFSLGLERAGMETVAFCEIEEYPRKVLKKHWPDVPIYEDVRDVTKQRLESDGITGIDIVTGGFPCQDISVAGKQAGIAEGTRSGLWSECARILGEFQPKYAIFENVTALISGEWGDWFKRVLWDISQVGYDAEWHCIPASELGAHHHRDRVWIISYPKSDGDKKLGFASSRENAAAQEGAEQPDKLHGMDGCGVSDISNTHSQRLQGREKFGIFGEGWQKWYKLTSGCFCSFDKFSEIEPIIRRGADGIPNHAHRLKGLGNAVVPQIPELIGRAIMEIERETN